MSLRRKLEYLARTIADQAEQDPEFARRIRQALGNHELPARGSARSMDSSGAWPKNRRPPAKLDPIEVIANGEDILRSELSRLSLDQLKDVVAEYGMDPGKLVMKWKKPERVIDRIVEISLSRAQKGDAFRSD